jgi:predicted aspartyl protease
MEIPTGEEVLMGTFFLNECPVTILFDSGASLDFISSACAERARLTLVASGVPYVISTPKGRVDTDRIAQKVLLELSRRVIGTNLIVLSRRGIDVILGMRWMKLHKVVFDIATRLVHMYSPMYGEVTLPLPMTSRIRECLQHVVKRRL